MSERPDNTDVLSEEEWESSAGEVLPPRARNRLLAPLSLTLIGVLLAAAGFLGGVLAQRGSEGGSSGGLPDGVPSLLRESAGTAGGFPSSGSGSAVSGKVSSVDGRTIYVKSTGGGTLAVRVGDGAAVTRDSNVGADRIRPGDSVVVQGAKRGSTVKASSVSVTESGVESTASAAPSTSGGDQGEQGEGSVELFGE